jgi:hypothetical protein
MNDLYSTIAGLARVQVLYVIFVIEVLAQHQYDVVTLQQTEHCPDK